MSRGTIRYDNKTLRELDALEFYSNTAINTVPALERLHLGVPKENPAYVPGPAQGRARASQKSNHGGPSALRLPCRESCSPSRRCSWEQNPPDCAAIPWRCTEARRAVRRSRSVRKRGVQRGGGVPDATTPWRGGGPFTGGRWAGRRRRDPMGALRALDVSMRRGTAIGSVRKRGCTIH